ncbi:MAG: hypothetical protein WCQ49_01575 [Candidatus Saccharibacteria bacterium]
MGNKRSGIDHTLALDYLLTCISLCLIAWNMLFNKLSILNWIVIVIGVTVSTIVANKIIFKKYWGYWTAEHSYYEGTVFLVSATMILAFFTAFLFSLVFSLLVLLVLTMRYQNREAYRAKKYYMSVFLVSLAIYAMLAITRTPITVLASIILP